MEEEMREEKNFVEEEDPEEKMEEESAVKSDERLLDLTPGEDDGGEVEDTITEKLLSGPGEEMEDDQKEQLEEKGRELTKMLTCEEEYRGVELTTFTQVKDYSEHLKLTPQMTSKTWQYMI